MTGSFLGEIAGGLELVLWFLAGLRLFWRWGYTLAEAVCCSLFTALMALSFFFQLTVLAGRPDWSPFLEAGWLVLLVLSAGRLPPSNTSLKTIMVPFFRQNRLPILFLALGWGLLLWHALDRPPDPLPVFWTDGAFSPGFDLAGLDVPSWPILNQAILPHLFARWGADLGPGLIGLSSYLVVIFGTYTLARRVSWPATSLTVALVVASMPRLVYLASTPNPEIVITAGGIFVLVALFRLLEQPNQRDLLLLILAGLFMISNELAGLVFPAILAPLSAVVLFRRHGVATWRTIFLSNRINALLALVPALVLSQIGVFILNLVHGHGWLAPASMDVIFNQDGIQGALANLGRYFLESLDLTRPLDLLLINELGFSPVRVLQGLHQSLIVPILDQRGAAAAFKIYWISNDFFSWFGPLAFFLILPALFYALFRGNRRLKAVAVAMCGYGYLMCLLAAWAPGNARYFSVFFCCSGFLTGFFLPPWRFTRKGQRRIQALSLALLLYATAFNTAHPLIDLGGFKRPGSAMANVNPASGPFAPSHREERYTVATTLRTYCSSEIPATTSAGNSTRPL